MNHLISGFAPSFGESSAAYDIIAWSQNNMAVYKVPKEIELENTIGTLIAMQKAT